MVAHQTSENVKCPNEFHDINVLLAYDGSEHAWAAVDFLSGLPFSHSKVTCLAVMGTQYISNHEALGASLKIAGEHLQTTGIETETILKAGNPAASIIEWADLHETDLIVMGAKGLRATLGILLGGVAQQVIENAKTPVMIVRAPFRGLKHLLVVVDGSTYSKRALQCLAPPKSSKQCRFPLPADVTIHLLNVLPPSIPPELASRAWTVGTEVMYPIPAKPTNWEEIEEQEVVEGNRILSEALEILEEGGLPAEKVLLRGDAATEIIQYVKAHEIDLVVCGSRGLNPISGWLLGSVSRKLVHYADCSVLIVK